MTGLEYGSTRLRARRARLLSATDYALLLGADSIDRLLGLLSETPYRPDIEAAIARYAGLRRLDAAVRSHLARSLRDVLSFYPDPPVPEVVLLLERWDVRNVRVILRGKAHPKPGLDVAPMTVPAGRLGEAELFELAAQDSVRSVIDLMIAWGLPSPSIARRLVSARGAYEASGDPVVLEDAVNRAYAGRLQGLPEPDTANDPSALLRAEIDAINVVTALRLFEVHERGESSDAADRFLPGGPLRNVALEAARAAATPADAVAAFRAERMPADWLLALVRWSEERDLVSLEQALAGAISRMAVGLFRHADPLGPGIPVAYVLSKETEARNLRWIGRGIVHGLSRDEVEAQVVVLA